MGTRLEKPCCNTQEILFDLFADIYSKNEVYRYHWRCQTSHNEAKVSVMWSMRYGIGLRYNGALLMSIIASADQKTHNHLRYGPHSQVKPCVMTLLCSETVG